MVMITVVVPLDLIVVVILLVLWKESAIPVDWRFFAVAAGASEMSGLAPVVQYPVLDRP